MLRHDQDPGGVNVSIDEAVIDLGVSPEDRRAPEQSRREVFRIVGGALSGLLAGSLLSGGNGNYAAREQAIIKTARDKGFAEGYAWGEASGVQAEKHYAGTAMKQLIDTMSLLNGRGMRRAPATVYFGTITLPFPSRTSKSITLENPVLFGDGPDLVKRWFGIQKVRNGAVAFDVFPYHPNLYGRGENPIRKITLEVAEWEIAEEEREPLIVGVVAGEYLADNIAIIRSID